MTVDVSLLSGWFPVAVQIATAAAVLLSAVPRLVPAVTGGVFAATAVTAWLVDASLGPEESPPAVFWAWTGVLLFALVMAVGGWRRARAGHRALAVLAVLLALLTSANALNRFVGLYPTVADAWANLTGGLPPGAVPLDELGSVPPDTHAGRVVPVDIPDDPSGFRHREEFVYLPPIWFARHPRLPVLEMIGGVLGNPQAWVRAGHAAETADRYARAHGGWAPVLVFVDPSGSFTNDTECVDGPHGQAEDHLTRDVPAYVERMFGTATAPSRWGVVGWSMGGTCAIDLTVEHPDVFRVFLDISGDRGPNDGDESATIRTLFAGDVRAFEAHDPLNVLDHERMPRGVTAIFADASTEARSTRAAELLGQACRRDGIDTTSFVAPGAHTWQFSGHMFADLLPRLAAALGIAG